MHRGSYGPLRAQPWWVASSESILLCVLASGLGACGRGEIAARATRDVEVRVLSQTGAPVAGAHLWVQPLAAPTIEMTRPVSATTGPNGIATLVDLPRDLECELTVSPVAGPPIVMDTLVSRTRHHPPPAFPRVHRSPWRSRDDVVTVQLNPTVLLRAVDASDGATPVAAAAFHVEANGAGAYRLGLADASGTFELVMEPNTTQRVQATARGSTVRLEPDAWTEVRSDAREATFRVNTRPQRIRVHLENRSKSDLTWNVKGRLASGGSDLAGRGSADVVDVDVEGLEPDRRYDLRFRELGGSEPRVGSLVGVAPSETIVTLRLSAGAEIRGRLRGASDLAGAKADATSDSPDDPVRRVEIAPDGTFLLRLTPGTWTVGAMAKGKERWGRVAKKVSVADMPIDLELVLE